MKKIVYFMFILLVLLAACSNEEEKSGNHEQKDTNKDNKEEATNQGENMYPLTGLYTDEPVDNRVIGVMVNNHNQARPQSGLSEADIVFEILAEAKITRFLALFQSEIPETVGPVRSAREYYFKLADGYDSIYVYHGAADFINEMIANEGISYLNGSTYDNDGKLFKRDSSRKAPHNSYALLNAVYEVAESKGYSTKAEQEPLLFLNETDVEAIEGDPAQHVEITYSTNPVEIVAYDYDAAAGNYKRFSNNEQTVELNDNTEITAENVFIVETYHEVIDDVGRRLVDMESGGNAYLLQKGKVQQVEWTNDNGKIIPVKNGQPIGFVPGKTWINVVPTNPSMEQAVTISNE